MNLKELLFGISIFVLTLFAVFYGFNTFYSKPKYDDFCLNSLWEKEVLNETLCSEIGGKWMFQNIGCATEPCSRGYCDKEFSCREDYEFSRDKYSMNLFFVFLPLGIILILIGAYFFIDFVGVGFMAAGVGIIIKGISSYWRYTQDWIRFLITFFGLVVLVYFSYRFSENFRKKKY